MGNNLVIQMARMGDFIQTTPLLRSIKNQSPYVKLWVLADKSIKSLAEHTPYIDEIITLDIKEISKLLSQNDNLIYQYELLKNRLNFLSELSFEKIYNINFSNITAVLSAIPKSGQVIGYSHSKGGKCVKKEPWFAFFNATVKYPRLSPFNLVDFFNFLCSKSLHNQNKLYYSLDSNAVKKSVLMLENENISDEDILIAFQLNTRHKQRQWPVRFFSELAQKLLHHKNIHIILLGSADDRYQANNFNKNIAHLGHSSLHRVHDFVDRTSIPELAGLLKRSNLLITCDTGTMHLATAVGCRVLAIFIGPAYVRNTGPYGNNHWIIQTDYPCSPCIEDNAVCNDFRCRKAITPDLVHALTRHILFKEDFMLTVPENIEIFKPCFDKWGVLYRPFINKRTDLNDVRNICYREIGKTIIRHKSSLGNYETDSFLEYSCTGYGHTLVSEVESAVRQGCKLTEIYFSDPFGLTRAKLDGAMFFWHPMIDYCLELKKNNECNDTCNNFISGMQAGLKVLRHIAGNSRMATL